MKHLRAYLFVAEPGAECEVYVFRDMESIEDCWRSRKSSNAAGALHVGFWRPDTSEISVVLLAHPGKMLLSEASVSALPETFIVSKHLVAQVGRLTLYLGLEGWGYDCTDPTLTQLYAPPNYKENPSSALAPSAGWLAQFAATSRDIAEEAFSAGILSEEEYIANENRLPERVREAMGIARFLHHTGGVMPEADSVFDFMPFAPPWFLALPITVLDLSVRSTNCLRAQEIFTLLELSQYGTSKIIKLQNLGRKSFREIGTKILSVLEGGISGLNLGMEVEQIAPYHRTSEYRSGNNHKVEGSIHQSIHALGSSFRETIDTLLSRLTERERKLISMRMGIDGTKHTLNSIAQTFDLTRERVRQIESRVIVKLKSARIWTTEFGARLTSLLDGRQDPLGVLGLDILDAWFDGVSEGPGVFQFAAERLSTPPFHIIAEGASTYVSKMQQQDWEDAKRSGQVLLESLAGQGVSRLDARRLVEGLMHADGSEWRSELWFVASRLARFAGPGDDELLISFGSGAEQIVEALLAASDMPLHYSEIHARAQEAGERLELRRIHAAAAKVGLLYGRGRYGSERHFPLSAPERRLLISEVDDLVAGGEASRQWHSREIFDALEERGLEFSGRLNPYIVSLALKESTHLSYLGRMVWATTSSVSKRTSDRLDVHQAVIAILISEGRPLTTEEIRAHLSKERGLNVYFQIQPIGSVVRVGTGLWGLEGRDLPFPLADVDQIISYLRQVLSVKEKGLHVTEVVSALVPFVSSIRDVKDPVLILGLAQKREGFSIGRGQYLYLSEWGESRRLTVYDATIMVLRYAGRKGINADAGISKIEALIERPLARNLYGWSCNNVGAVYDDSDGVWYLPESADDTLQEVTLGAATSN